MSSSVEFIDTSSTMSTEEWDIPSLLHLTDAVRTCVSSGSKLSDEQVQFMETVLQKLLDEDKAGKHQSIPFIAQTRIELLARDIVTTGMHNKNPTSDYSPDTLELKCFALQRCWRKNFRPSYFVSTIDEERQNAMEEISLKNVTLNPEDGRWTVKDAKSEHYSHTEGTLDFKPGQWWLNLACCYRDGIVGSMFDDLTKGPYGITAMPLLTGEEIESTIPDCFTYRQVGPIQDMYICLMSQLGQKHVRILRGYKLKSPNAPKGGIRYDGLYTPIEYSHKFDTVTNLYEVKLLFKRNNGTPRIETLSNIPKPSQMDEWKLYLLMAVNEKDTSRPNRIRFEPEGDEERGSGVLKSAEFLEALKIENPSDVMIPESKSVEPKKKLVAQDNEERGGLFKSSDFMDIMSQGPETVGQPSSIRSSSPPPPPSSKIPVPMAKKKLVAQGNEERASMRSNDLLDLLNEGPLDEGVSLTPIPSPKKISAASSLVNKAKSAKKAPVVPVKESGGDTEEPVVVKKRVKRDLYDIDQMMEDIEGDKQFQDEEPPKRGPKV